MLMVGFKKHTSAELFCLEHGRWRLEWAASGVERCNSCVFMSFRAVTQTCAQWAALCTDLRLESQMCRKQSCKIRLTCMSVEAITVLVSTLLAATEGRKVGLIAWPYSPPWWRRRGDRSGRHWSHCIGSQEAEPDTSVLPCIHLGSLSLAHETMFPHSYCGSFHINVIWKFLYRHA